ncbi:uncharacterized protein I303_105177 [Kwoniella dejecticola CBS 10117]|uniref:Uncharacterized protein n=1 Tax=Kwoniella dejecticola CBS 10117 TaxID=1296121 RepID=A0A1A6A383_9TREE|nr:uncharacterized protein I303_05376 [Kwoniella dejecticola CBS 10117]OBR84518.1 hypothetical protein I303_05376 [Kwoniella dejecticola CBS 10117]
MDKSAQRVVSQPSAKGNMRLVRQSSDQRTPDDVSIFSFSEDTKAGWCGCFGARKSSNKEKSNLESSRSMTNEKPPSQPTSTPPPIAKSSPTFSSPTSSPPTPMPMTQQGYGETAFQPYSGALPEVPPQQLRVSY